MGHAGRRRPLRRAGRARSPPALEFGASRQATGPREAGGGVRARAGGRVRGRLSLASRSPPPGKDGKARRICAVPWTGDRRTGAADVWDVPSGDLGSYDAQRLGRDSGTAMRSGGAEPVMGSPLSLSRSGSRPAVRPAPSPVCGERGVRPPNAESPARLRGRHGQAGLWSEALFRFQQAKRLEPDSVRVASTTWRSPTRPTGRSNRPSTYTRRPSSSRPTTGTCAATTRGSSSSTRASRRQGGRARAGASSPRATPPAGPLVPTGAPASAAGPPSSCRTRTGRAALTSDPRRGGGR